MKKLVSVILCAGIMGGTALAHTVETPEGEPVVIVNETGESGATIAFFVVKSGEDINDNTAITAGGYTVADENGLARFVFEMKEDSRGVYDLYIKEDGNNLAKFEKAFTYVGVGERNELMEKVRSGEVKNLISDENAITLEAIGCKYNKLNEAEKSRLGDILSDENLKNVSEKEFSVLFNTALAVVKINVENDVNNISEYIGFADPVYNGKSYSSIADSKLLSWISECISINGKYDSVDEFDNMYKISNVLYEIDNARVDDIEKILKDNEKILGIEDEDEYEEYASLAKKHTANEKIVKALKKTNVYKVSELLDVIEDAIEEKKQTSGGGGGGGASGGSSTAGGSSSEWYVTAVPETKETKKSFGDINSDHWAYEAVIELSESGIVSGDENGNFRPDDTVTREEFIKMLVTAADAYDENAECEFSDVSKNAWYYKYVASGVKSGIVKGVSETLFGTGNRITRQDMMVLAGRSTDKLSKIRDYDPFADENEISDYAKDEVIRLYESGIANGMENNEFVPYGNATRAQAAQIIYNIFLSERG